MAKDQGEELACSIIMISENATLKTPTITRMILCHNCEQQECQDIVLYFSL